MPAPRVRRTLSGLTLCLVAALAATAPPASADAPAADAAAPLWTGTFDEPAGAWAAGSAEHFGHPENAAVVPGPPGANGDVLRVRTPARQKWGIDLRKGFAEMGLAAREEAWLRYRIWFPADYEWAEGGKIPGLSGITQGDRQSSTSSGGEYSERSWSGRLYWKEDAGLVSYLYVKHADGRDISRSDGRYVGISPRWYRDADRRRGYAAFVPGAWNTVELHYRMNTPGRNDGWHRGWLNGRLGIDLRDVQYRTAGHPDLSVNQLFAAIFFGGDVMPRSDQTLYVDDMAISAGPAPGPPAAPGAPGGPLSPAEGPRSPRAVLPAPDPPRTAPRGRDARPRVVARLGRAAGRRARVQVRVISAGRRAGPWRVRPRGRAGLATLALPVRFRALKRRPVRVEWRPRAGARWRPAARSRVVTRVARASVARTGGGRKADVMSPRRG